MVVVVAGAAVVGDAGALDATDGTDVGVAVLDPDEPQPASSTAVAPKTAAPRAARPMG